MRAKVERGPINVGLGTMTATVHSKSKVKFEETGPGIFDVDNDPSSQRSVVAGGVKVLPSQAKVVTDPDGDGLASQVDPCPTIASFWLVPVGDGDCDGWTDADEVLIGTIPGDPCPDTTAAIDDAWPADLDTDFGFRVINALDIAIILPPVFGSTRAGGPPYLERYDLDRAFGDGVINALDISVILPPMFGSSCT